MLHLNNSEIIKAYEPMFKKIEVPATAYPDIIQGSVAKYGVRWIYNKRVFEKKQPITQENEISHGIGEASSQGPGPKRRNRVVKYLWYVNYYCHRAGSKENRTFPNVSGKQRKHLKGSKKNNCPVRMKVTCLKSDPSMVTIEVINEHNHTIGSVEDLKYLPLLKEGKE
ncbi:hypothetical protein BD770DRAFT_398152 [Pilaira anomala]|nr:hypothetical protein BD770DRAFT_398152 [Pilaira anomala]